MESVNKDIYYLTMRHCKFGGDNGDDVVMEECGNKRKRLNFESYPIRQRLCKKFGKKWYSGTIVDNTFEIGNKTQISIIYDDYNDNNYTQSYEDLDDGEIEDLISNNNINFFDNDKICDNGIIKNNLLSKKGRLSINYKDINNKAIEKAIKNYGDYKKKINREDIKEKNDEKINIEKEKYETIPSINFDIIMDNDQKDIKIILELLSLMDMYKDFITNVLGNETNTSIQKKILLERIINFVKINKNFFDNHTELKKNLDKNNIPNINKELDILLGVSPQMPKQLMTILFPDIIDKEIFFVLFMRYLKKITNSDNPIKEFKKLKKYSNDFKNENISEQELKKFFTVPDKLTISWIDATPGTKRIPIITGILSLLAKQNLLKSFKNYGTKLDAASENNEITKMTNNLKTFNEFYMNERQININFKSKNNELLVKLIINKLFKNNNLQLIIEDFYGLDCSDTFFSNTNNKINRSICWEKINNLFRDNQITETTKFTKEIIRKDLCIKANKTAMDMLKQFFAKQYIKENPNEDIISIFNDLNSAKLMAAISKKGFVVYGSAIKSLDLLNDDDTEERIIFRKEWIDILLEKEEQIESSVIFYDAESQLDNEEEISSVLRSHTDEEISSVLRSRNDGNCQFDSLALNYIKQNGLEMNENNMKRISINIQNEIRNYMINNIKKYNFNNVDDQSVNEINLFLGNTPQQGGWGNAATLGAYANLTGTTIYVHLPNRAFIPITSNNPNGIIYDLYLDNPDTLYGHYDAFFPPETSFGKTNKFKSIDADIKYLLKL